MYILHLYAYDIFRVVNIDKLMIYGTKQSPETLKLGLPSSWMLIFVLDKTATS